MTFTDKKLTARYWLSTGWPALALAVLVALRLSLPAATIEAVYSRGFFPYFRRVWDATVAYSPLPLFFVFWAVALILLALALVRCRRVQRRKSTWAAVRYAVYLLLRGAIKLAVLFFLMWGFNYGRVPVEEQMGFSRYQPSQEELRSRVYTEAAELGRLRSLLSTDTLALRADLLPSDLESRVRAQVAQVFVAHGYPAAGRPRARRLRPKGVLLRWSTAGVYWPWAGEANIDDGLYHLQKPAVMAHEFAHAYGFGDEGTCTFWAWLAGREVGDDYLNYTFKLAYWRQIAGRLRQAEPEAYTEWRATRLDAGVRNDLQAIYENSALYQDIAPVVRDLTYDAYLRTQGVHDGIANYGTVIQLVEGYRKNKLAL